MSSTDSPQLIMENEKKKNLLERAKRMKETTKNVNDILLPKLSRFKDNFTPSEWDIIRLAINNYIIDIDNEATRLQIMVQQNFG